MFTDITLTTPGLLFSTISLVMLAYTNRFLALAKLIRELYDKYQSAPDPRLFQQIHLLRRRVRLIKRMQLICALSLSLSVVSMLFLLNEQKALAAPFFEGSLVLMLLSLIFSVVEISISTMALNLSLADLEAEMRKSDLQMPSLLQRVMLSKN